MRAQLGPIVSAAQAQARLWSHDEVRAELGLTRAPSPAERALVVPVAVSIRDSYAESRARVEARWEAR